jgi:hypothetical protein
MDPKARVLVVGLEPTLVDFTHAPPGWNAEKVSATIAAENARLDALGYATTTLYVDTGETAAAVLTDALARGRYDCILIGAGIRTLPNYFLLFEQLLNVIHQHAPASAKICFNTNPSDSAEAVQRWV